MLPLPYPYLVDLPLAVALLVLALWLVGARHTRSAAIGFTAYGLIVAIAWVRLGALDVALTEAALGGIIGLLLLMAAARLGDAADGSPPGWSARVPVALLCGAVTLGLLGMVLLLPEPAPSLVAAVAEQQAATALENPVAAVLVAFRAVDTLLESAVLALAVIGLWSFGADEAWGARPRLLGHDAPSPALVLLARLLPPVGLMVGVHLFWTGADHPGGPFQAGALLAAMAALVWLARLGAPPPVCNRLTRVGLMLGPLVFLLIGLAGAVVADAFMAYPEGLTKPLILIIEAAKTLSVAVALALLVAGPPARPAVHGTSARA
jgi:multisubunit Na+/H+ antiporter MnhB subunit